MKEEPSEEIKMPTLLFKQVISDDRWPLKKKNLLPDMDLMC